MTKLQVTFKKKKKSLLIRLMIVVDSFKLIDIDDVDDDDRDLE